jgi:hypothetical protein
MVTAEASRKMRGVSRYEATKAVQRGQPATWDSRSVRTSAASVPSRYSINSSTPEAQATSVMASPP